MPASAETTRSLLIDAATHEFARHGVRNASLLEVTRRAGQRNRGSVHYHFGSREGILAAVLSQHHDFLGARHLEMMAAAEQQGDLESAVRGMVLPAVELGEQGWRGHGYLAVLAEVSSGDHTQLAPEVAEALMSSGGFPLWQLLAERLSALRPDLCPCVVVERQHLASTFIMRTVAGHWPVDEGATGSHRSRLDRESFVENLVAMTLGMLTAGTPTT